MASHLPPAQRALVDKGVREALMQIGEHRHGAIHQAQALFDLALDGDGGLLAVLTALAEEADRRALRDDGYGRGA